MIFTKPMAARALPARPQMAHKGAFGRVLVVAGSSNMMGANLLAARAVFSAGAGYVFCAVYPTERDVVFSNLPEAVLVVLEPGREVEILTCALAKNKIDLVLAGPGLGENKFITRFLDVLEEKRVPFVLDGDGLNALARAPRKFSVPCIFTPHPKEAERLLGQNFDDREAFAREITSKYGCVCVLKGANTVISGRDGVFINQTGNSALSKAGSGDVLSGLLAGFWAQAGLRKTFKESALNTAALAAYLHGRAAEIYAEKNTQYCLLASQITTCLSAAVKEIL